MDREKLKAVAADIDKGAQAIREAMEHGDVGKAFAEILRIFLITQDTSLQLLTEHQDALVSLKTRVAELERKQLALDNRTAALFRIN